MSGLDELKDWQSPIEGSLDRVTFPGGKLDEIVGSGIAHLEHMGGDSWFLIIGHDDGTETAVWFRSKDLRRPSYERRAPRAQIAHVNTAYQPPSTVNETAAKAGTDSE